MRNLIITVLVITAFLITATPINAIYDPLSQPNNKFGIHITDMSDLNDASELVNSSGGDWGYVTLVIQENDKDPKKWQLVFDRMRELHLIPIIRISSSVEDNKWKILNKEDVNSWIDFLDSLNWVTKNRYLVVGNEPNRADEWGGNISPSEYTDYLINFSVKAKQKSGDFFILNAGFDASAPNKKNYMDEATYLSLMKKQNEEVFKYIDGWASHSYPNPNFSGSPKDTGKGSIRTYSWELAYLKSLGVDKNLPVFITETGWAHNANAEIRNFTNSDDVGKYLTQSFSDAWNDKNIVAVTPFLLNYPQKPFEMFSWKDAFGNKYPFFEIIKNLLKQKGQPIQVNTGLILHLIYPVNIPEGQDFTLIAEIENTGQKIWNPNEIMIESQASCLDRSLYITKSLKPFEKQYFTYKTKVNLNSLIEPCKLGLYFQNELLSNLYPLEIKLETYDLKNEKRPFNLSYLMFLVSEFTVKLKSDFLNILRISQ